MLAGNIGVAVGYIVIVFLLCWFVILSKGRIIWKIITIAFSIFYAISLYLYLPSIAGYPTTDEIPDGSVLLSLKVQEPKGSNPGAFYLMCNPKPDLVEKAVSCFSPKGFLAYTGKDEPRIYKLPYDRELHKKLLEQKKKAQKVGGFLIVTKKKGKKGRPKAGQQNRVEKNIDFKIINPVDILTKE